MIYQKFIFFQLDEQNDCLFHNKTNFVHTFSIQNKKRVKFIRIRQTVRNWRDQTHLSINCIEYIGEIV